MGEKDAAAIHFLADNRRFADVCNYYLYQGQEKIRPEMLREQDTRELLHLLDREGKAVSVQKWRDILKSAVLRCSDDCIYLIIGMESQSEIHYAMPVRGMLYDALDYSRQVDELSRYHREQKDWKDSAEFLSGFCREDKLIPVVTITIYWGSESWDGPRSLHDMLQKGNVRKVSGKLQDETAQIDILKYVPDYKLNLIAPAEIEDFDKFHTSVREVMEILKYKEDEEAMNRLLHSNPAYQNLENEAVDVINKFAGLGLSINEEKGETDMCKAWDDHKRAGIQEGRQAGIQEGRKAGIQETLRALYQSGDISAEVAAEKMNVSLEEFLSLL